MPPYKKYVSDAQRRWAHTATGEAALGAADVAGKDKVSKGEDLPERVNPVKQARKRKK